MAGKLILGATPIGNLGDLSRRLVETLESADELWCEDTRVTRKLLAHLKISKKLNAFHEFSDLNTQNRFKAQLERGQTLLYVSDAGMPGISDPGFELVRLAREVSAEIDVLPGPSSVLSALVLSGFPCHQFAFFGFFPEKLQAQLKLLERIRLLALTTIHFESPNRIERTLEFFASYSSETQVAVCRELTKLHQETLVGTAAQVIQNLKVKKGEIVLVVAPVSEVLPEESPKDFYSRLLAEGLHPRDALKKTASTFGLKKRDVYRQIMIQ